MYAVHVYRDTRLNNNLFWLGHVHCCTHIYIEIHNNDLGHVQSTHGSPHRLLYNIFAHQKLNAPIKGVRIYGHIFLRKFIEFDMVKGAIEQ